MIATNYWSDDTADLYLGDTHNVLSALPDGYADCIVTSPPYWAKRDYGVTGQYGHEPGPALYVATLRTVFNQARRVLADDGTCWLNLGDSYSPGSAVPTGPHTSFGGAMVGHQMAGAGAKNLLGLPWRVALALQEDGWIIRNAIVWHKPNAMPESVRDRLNSRYELIFLLVKTRHYWFDLDPIRIPHATSPGHRRSPHHQPVRHPGGGKHSGTWPGCTRATGSRPLKYGAHTWQVVGARGYANGRRHRNGRNPGDVWSIPTRPYRGPHFAAFPIDLPLRCIQAGCKPGGTVLDPFCGTGTTGIAARQLGRRFTGIDLNPAFLALTAERLRQSGVLPPGTDSGNGNRCGNGTGNEGGNQ